MYFFPVDCQSVIPSRLLFLLFLWLSAGVAPALGQQATPVKGTLSGTLVDAKTRQPLPFATVTAYRTADTAILSYRLSDDAGKFTLQHVPVEVPAYVVVAFSGYKVVRHPFVLTPDSVNGQLDTLALTPDTLTLDEVLIAAERPPVVFRHDTIEFNAESFKTLPSALVEDLLRKLPGVRVDASGNITVNGQKVNRIMVDGKDFFGGDPKVASRNLTANMIEKVQVTEDKEQRNGDPMLNASEVGVIVNLKIKKGMKKGWFGKATVGVGPGLDNPLTPNEISGIANLFRDTLQVSILGGGNNLGRSSLSMDDLMSTGGFDRGGMNSMMWSNTGGMAINDVSFGGAETGLQFTRNGGVNLNYSIGKKLDLNARYLIGDQVVKEVVESRSERSLGDTTLVSADSSDVLQGGVQHSVGMELNWKPDTLTRIEFSPSYTWSGSQRLSNLLSTTNRITGGQSVELNKFDSQIADTAAAHKLGLSIWGERKFHKKDRKLLIQGWTNINLRDQSIRTNAITIVESEYRTTLQGRQGNRSEVTSYGRVRYQEPLTEKLLWTVAFSNTTTVIGDTVETTNRSLNLRLDSLSNAMQLRYQANTLTTSLIWTIKHKEKEVKIQPFVGLQALNFDNRYQSGEQLRKPFYNVLPGFRVNYGKFGLNYELETENIDERDLRPVLDNTNPMRLVYGNPGLLPPLKHRVNLNYFYFNPVKNTKLYYGVWSELNQRGIAYERGIDSNGYQFTRPINASGMVDGNMWGGYTFPVKVVDSLTTELDISGWGGVHRDVMIFNGIQATPWRYDMNADLTLEASWKEAMTAAAGYSFSYMLNTFNQSEVFSNQTVIWHTVNAKLNISAPKNFLWDASINYRFNPNPAPGFRASNLLLNAGASWLFLKDQRGQLKLSAFDLLNQNQALTRTVSTNEVLNQSSLVLRRYFMLSFSYDLRPAEKKKVRNWWEW